MTDPSSGPAVEVERKLLTRRALLAGAFVLAGLFYAAGLAFTQSAYHERESAFSAADSQAQQVFQLRFRAAVAARSANAARAQALTFSFGGSFFGGGRLLRGHVGSWVQRISVVDPAQPSPEESLPGVGVQGVAARLNAYQVRQGYYPWPLPPLVIGAAQDEPSQLYLSALREALDAAEVPYREVPLVDVPVHPELK